MRHNGINNQDIAIVSGFGDKGIAELKAELEGNLQRGKVHTIKSAPWNKAFQSPETIVATVSEALAKINQEKILIGHSYGALIALVIACRRQLQDVDKLILIDGPLRSDVEVKPVKVGHHIFFRHYKDRVRLAQECEDILQQLPDERILTIGTAKDRIVPPVAKQLKTNPVQMTLTSKEQAASVGPIAKEGTNIIVDFPEMHGHALTPEKAKIYATLIQKFTAQ